MDRDAAICSALRQAAQTAAEEMAAKANRIDGEIAELEVALAAKRAELLAVGCASEEEVERHAYVEERTEVEGKVVWVARRGRLYVPDAVE